MNASTRTLGALAGTASSVAKSRSAPDTVSAPEASAQSSTATPSGKPNIGHDEEAVWATNYRLHQKVLALQEQLRVKQEAATKPKSCDTPAAEGENSALELPCDEHCQPEIQT